jgi:hypothetical protein
MKNFRLQRTILKSRYTNAREVAVILSLLVALPYCIFPVTVVSAQQTYTPAGIQSGPDVVGSSFASAAIFNPADNTVVVTGTTYGRFWQDRVDEADSSPGCFLVTARLPEVHRGDIAWVDSGKISTIAHKEGCSSIALRGSKLFLSGHADTGGVLEELRNSASIVPSTQYGMLLDMDYDGGSSRVDIVGGRVLQDSPVVFPVAVVALPGESEVYVASMATDSTVDHDYSNEQLDPQRFFPYGSKFHMTVSRLSLNGARFQEGTVLNTLDEQWTKPYSTKEAGDVYVAGMIKLSNEILVVVGSTTGYGGAVGGLVDTGPDMDGFVTKLHPVTGGVPVEPGNPKHQGTVRIQSVDGKDDFVAGVCHDAYRHDPGHIYIVGSTSGDLDRSGSAAAPRGYLMKLDFESLQPVWTKVLAANAATTTIANATSGGRPSVRGVSCVVTPDGEAVYAAGVVENSGVLPLSGTMTSFGGKDIYVVKYDTVDGKEGFVRQIGSSEDDEMAMRGGLLTDSQGNAVLVGHTAGSLYRTREESEKAGVSDIFLLTISRYDGKYQFPIEHPEYGQQVEEDVVSGPGSAPQTPEMSGTTMNAKAPSTTGSDSSDVLGLEKWTGLTILLVGILTSLLLVGLLLARRSNREVYTSRNQVLDYLHQFDVEDVDLKHSATGGWHCSYTNGLAHGINIRDGSSSSNDDIVAGPSQGFGLLPVRTGGFDPLTTPLNSSTLRDSLFVNDDSDGRLGRPDGHHSFGDDSSADRRHTAIHESRRSSTRKTRRKKLDAWGREIV